MTDCEQLYTLSIPEAELELLRKKLDLVRLPDELDDAGWEYGTPLADMQRILARWKSGYNWREAEAKINKLPQYTRDIEVDGFGKLNIHYIHQKSHANNAIPLLFMHGCKHSLNVCRVCILYELDHTGPGHYLEVWKMLPLLTAVSPDHPSFHVVAPSLPGFGFSEAPKKPGFCGKHYAEVKHLCWNRGICTLMTRSCRP